MIQNIINAMKHAGSLVTKLKEKRFTSTARVLGDKKALGVTVRVVDQPNGGAAWWDSFGRIITLNDAVPATKDSKLMLIWERAKLYHELFHVLFTTQESLRKSLCLKSNNRDRYLWVSNALEDGRIEHFGGKVFAGTTWYIRTLLKVLVKSDSPDSGLLLYVRTKMWRNAKEAKFWGKYQKLIDESITAIDSGTVWENAFEIVQDMEKPQPKPEPPQGKPEPTEDDGEKGNPQPSDEDEQDDQDWDDDEESDEDEDDESGEGEGESNDDGSESEDDSEEGNAEPTDSEEDAEDSEEGQDSGEASNEAGNASEEQETPSAPPTPQDGKMSPEVERELKKMIDEAMEQIDDEVDAELIEIDREATDYVAEQEFKDGHEANIADQLTEVFASILVDSKRQRFQSCKRGGTLDTKRLLETQTGGEFMHERIDKASQPHIVLLIDLSFSMDWQRTELTQAARILHGAIHASGAVGITLTFGAYQLEPEKIDAYSTVPELFNAGWGTPTAEGLIAAREWLNDAQARRGMVIVITDGEPNSKPKAATRFQELSNDGYYVLNVMLGATPNMVAVAKTMCHDYVCIKDATELVRELEAPIGNFMSGSF